MAATSAILLSLLLAHHICPCIALYEVVDFVPPGPPAPPKNTTLIGLYSTIRSYGSSRESTDVVGWSQPFIAKTALLAWRDGLLLDPPAIKAPVDFDLLFLDECRSPTPQECSQGRTINFANRLMLGDRYVGQSFPPVVAMMGGSFFTNTVAKQAAALGIPNVGYSAWAEEYGDRTQYPMFMRVCTSTASGKKAMLKVLKELAFTRTILWMCNNNDMAGDRDVFLSTLGPQIGITIMALVMPQSSINGCMPWDPTVRAGWVANVKAAKESGIHAHIGWWAYQCAVYDIMHYFAAEGLVSRGHFWIGGELLFSTVYTYQYLPQVKVNMCPLGAPASQQFLTPFATERALQAFDGYTFLNGQLDSTNAQKWFTWFQTFKGKLNQTFEPWYSNITIPEAAWVSTKQGFWSEPWSFLFFDAIWIILRGINSLMVETNSTTVDGQRLLARMRNDNFDGLSGKVQFDERGERVAFSNIGQWRIGCSDRRLEAQAKQQEPVELEEASGPEADALRAAWQPQLQAMAERQRGAPAAAAATAAPATRALAGTGAYAWVGTFGLKLDLTKPLRFFGCSSQVPPDADLACAQGSFYDTDAATCTLCPKGTASSLSGRSFCSACPGGMYGASEGQSVCQACVSGKFSLTGATGCSNCSAGAYTADVQQTQCLACPAGKYAANTGTTDCPRCELGSFQRQNGQQTCDSCPEHQVTLFPGSSDPADCTCPPGWYWTAGTCTKCSDIFVSATVTCVGDRAPSMVNPGFMTLAGGAEVYLCRSDAACPGGAPVGVESCSAGSAGIACARCSATQRYDMKEGACLECSNAGVGIFWALLGFGIFALAVKLMPPETEYGVRSLTVAISAMFVAVPLAQCGDLVQFQSILGKSAVRWPKEVGPTYNALSGVLEFRSFSVECFLGADKDAYPLRYVVLANMLPLFLIASCALLAAPSLLFGSLRRWRVPDPLRAVSAALSVMLAVFLTVLNWALNLVFSTYEHPQHGERSLQSFPHILTSNSSMKALQAVSITAVAVWCAGTFALVAFLLYLLPRRRERMFLRRCTLALVARYSEDKAWWVLVEMTLKILTCITLSIFDSGSSHLVWLGCVYSAYLLLTALAQPYRFARHSLFDILLTFGKLWVIVFSMPLLEGAGGGRAFGVTLVTYLFYCIGALCVAWCAVDRLRGHGVNVELERNLFAWLRALADRVLPLQHNVEELVSQEVQGTLKISKCCSQSESRSGIGSEKAAGLVSSTGDGNPVQGIVCV